MTKVQDIINAISDEDLRDMVAELHELGNTGVLPGAKVRNLALSISNQVDISIHDSLTIAQTSVLRMAAFKWAGVQ